MRERREQQNSLAAEGSSGPIVKNDEEKQREDADHIAQKLFEQQILEHEIKQSKRDRKYLENIEKYRSRVNEMNLMSQ